MVYRFIRLGYVAGKYYNQPGNGGDTICLPETPTWSNYTDGNAGCCRGYIYGSEIHVDEQIFSNSVNKQDLPCAVCLSKTSTILMIPGRSSCFKGWREEYRGYVMANHHSHTGPHNHICVDYEPEFVPNGGNQSNEHILYLIEVQCGSLPCPPYVHGRELACVVCSR